MPFRPSPTFAYANMTMPTTNTQHEQFGPAPALGQRLASGRAVLAGRQAAAQRLVGRAGDGTHEDPPFPVAALAGAGQSAGMAGLGGLTSLVVSFPLTFTLSLVGLSFSHAATALSAFWQRW